MIPLGTDSQRLRQAYGDLGLVSWGGAALRRRLWWRRRVIGVRHAIAQAVRWTLGKA
jgi:hypothetical protein